MGSAPIAAAAARTKNPVRQALVSSTGTFWDTVVVCLMTGLVLVSTIMKNPAINADQIADGRQPVSYTHLDGYKRQVVANDGAHSLDNPVGRHVDEGLEFKIYAQDSHVNVGKCGEDAVQDADEDRRQQHHDAGRDTDTVTLAANLCLL